MIFANCFGVNVAGVPECGASARIHDQGASDHVAAVLRCQVDRAVRAGEDEVIDYTDMFDQPYYTKKLAHAGPSGVWAIGRSRAITSG